MDGGRNRPDGRSGGQDTTTSNYKSDPGKWAVMLVVVGGPDEIRREMSCQGECFV